MGAEFFMLLVALHWEYYLLWLLLSALVLWPVMRRCSDSWFDPMRYFMLFAMLANAVPPFLYQQGLCSEELLLYFYLSEALLWAGILTLARPRKPFAKIALKYDAEVGYQLYVFAFVVYTAVTLLSYALYGVPLFLDKSRLSVYAESGGFGLFIRINGFLAIYILVYGFYLLQQGRQRLMSWLGLAGVSLILLLNGSKSGLLNVMFAFWGYSVYYLGKVPQSKRVAIFLLVGMLAAIGILLVQTANLGGTWLTAAMGFVTRLSASGDAYFIGFPYNNYDVVEVEHPMRYLFSGPLAAFRLIPPEETTSIGNQLGWYIYPKSVGENLGPNARMPLLSYILYGWGGLVLSYIGGLLISWVLYRLPRYLPSGIIATAFFTYVYIHFASGVTDLGLGLGFLFDFFVNGILLLGLVYGFSYYQEVKHRSASVHSSRS